MGRFGKLEFAFVNLERRLNVQIYEKCDMLTLSLSEITKFCNPFEVPVWWELKTPITIEEIKEAIENESYKNANKPFSKMFPNRENHINRIAYLVKHPATDPIEIGSEGNWLINDGNHRLAAAIYRGDKTIEVSFYGCLEKIECLFGSEIAKQVERIWDNE